MSGYDTKIIIIPEVFINYHFSWSFSHLLPKAKIQSL